jgi:hypothetical protein
MSRIFMYEISLSRVFDDWLLILMRCQEPGFPGTSAVMYYMGFPSPTSLLALWHWYAMKLERGVSLKNTPLSRL